MGRAMAMMESRTMCCAMRASAGRATAVRSTRELADAPPTGYALATALFASLGRKLSARDACRCAPARVPPEPVPCGLGWAIIRPKSGGLALLEREAEAMGLAAYAPRERALAVSVRIGAYVTERALFPGYLFVSCPKGRPIDFRALEAARGGGPALMREGAPVMVRGAIIEALCAAEIAGSFDCVAAGLASARRGRLAKGAMVEIMDGPFAGLIGQVRKAEAGGRIGLIVEGSALFDRLTVPVADVRAL
jgi:transcription antitermination factor NusG